MTKLKKMSVTRNCDNCFVEFAPNNTKCVTCEKNPNVTMKWNPNPELAKNIVIHYMEEKEFITADEIAEIMDIEQDIVELAMAQLVEDGVLIVKKTLSISKPKGKK